MAMKPETRYYVLLGKVLSAVKSSLTLRESAIDFEGTAESDTLLVRVTVANKQLMNRFDLADEKLTEQEVLDVFMGLYNVTD